MCAVVKFALLALCFALTAQAASPQARQSEFSLMQFMLQSRGIQQEHPQRSMACFDHYVPLLNSITEQYEQDYADCIAAADIDRGQVDDDTQPQREKIEATAQSSCQALQTCTTHESSTNYFECFVNSGTAGAKSMYTISADATEILAEVRESYRKIDNSQYRCTNASERAYVENTAATYEELQSCLQGKTPVPTTTTAAPTEPTTTEEPTTEEPTTEEPSTEEPTTEEPTTEEPTTEEPSTEEPTTTEEPSTEEPTTEEPTTEEPTTEEPTTEDPTTEEPTTEEPTTEEPTTEEPSTEEPTTEEPSTEEPTTEEPTTEEPTTEEPTTEEPTTEEPITEEPTTEEATTEEPSTEEPTTEEPSTVEPTTDKPATDDPNPEVPTDAPSTEATTIEPEEGSGSNSESNSKSESGSQSEEMPEEDLYEYPKNGRFPNNYRNQLREKLRKYLVPN